MKQADLQCILQFAVGFVHSIFYAMKRFFKLIFHWMVSKLVELIINCCHKDTPRRHGCDVMTAQRVRQPCRLLNVIPGKVQFLSAASQEEKRNVIRMKHKLRLTFRFTVVYRLLLFIRRLHMFLYPKHPSVQHSKLPFHCTVACRCLL